MILLLDPPQPLASSATERATAQSSPSLIPRRSLLPVFRQRPLVETVIDEMERLGIATAEELEPETLADRVFAEVAATESVVVGRAEIGAWSHT